jgi:hypothetical protein
MTTPFRRLLHKWFGATATGSFGGSPKRRPHSFRPLFQELEDRLAPAAVTSVVTSGPGITAGTGDLHAGQTVKLTVNFDQNVAVDTTHGFPTLALNVGGTAAYSGTSGTTALTFLYTVAAGQNTSDLTVTALKLNGAAITDTGTGASADVSGAATNPAGILQIDTLAPTATIALVGNANQAEGSVLHYTVTFSEPVSGVDTTGFSLTTNGVAGASVSSVTPGSDAAHYTVNVASGNLTSGTGSGTLILNLTGANIKDLAGNGVGGGSFSAAPGSPVTVAPSPQSVAIVDVNGDGIPDILTISGSFLSVLLGTSNGSFSPAPGSPFNLGASAVSMSIADVNGDGIPDIATANGGGTTTDVSVLLGNGNGSFSSVPGSPFFIGQDPNAVAIGDVNGDGKPDFITANGGIVHVFGESATVLLGTGSGTFSQAAGSPYPVGANPMSVAIADVNGDTKPDLVIANHDDNNVSVLLGNGGGSFSAATGSPFAVGTSPTSVVVADINHDGRADIITANSGTNNVSVLLGNVGGGFTAATGSPFAVGSSPRSVAVADVNGDGKLDIVTANSGSNNVSVLFGDGSGSFGAANNFAVGGNPSSVAIADINGDGRPDLAVANQQSNFGNTGLVSTVSLLSNRVIPQAGPSVTLSDQTPPTLGSVNDGTGADINVQPYVTTISANWSGFSDTGSGIKRYEWAIGTTPGGTNVQAFTSVGTRTSARNSLLNLTEGTTYYVSVRAIDNAGNTSTAVSSNGVTIIAASSYLKNNTGTFADSDGDRYTVSLTPSNVGQVAVVQTASPRGPIQRIILQNTDPTTSVLTITVVRAKGTGDGLVSIGEIQCLGTASQPLGLGTLKSIVAANCDLLGSLTLGGTPTQATSITLHNIANGASITSGGKITALTAASVGTASITAPCLGTLTVAGDFGASVTLTGQGVPANQLTLTQATIGGTVRGATLNVAGNVGTFKAGAFVDSLVALSSFFELNTFQVTGIAGSSTAAFSNSNVHAAVISTVTLKSVQTNNNGTKFGILAQSTPVSVTVGTPAFTFDPNKLTPQGIGDFQVLDDQRGFGG